MSKIYHFSQISEQAIREIGFDLKFPIVNDETGMRESRPVYRVDGEYITVPMWYATKHDFPADEKIHQKIINGAFIGALRNKQPEYADRLYELLVKNSSALCSLYPGSGKTTISIFLAIKFGLKPGILVSQKSVRLQWKEELNKFAPDLKVFMPVKGSDPKKITNADVLLLSPSTPKYFPTEMKSIGFLVVDEVDTMITRTRLTPLTYIFPRYLLFLTATPRRTDGMEKIIWEFINPHSVVSKDLEAKFDVIVLKTGISVVLENKIIRGKKSLDFSAYMRSIVEDSERNELIKTIACTHYHRKILIATRRVVHVKYLVKLLSPHIPKVSAFHGNMKTFDKDADVIVACLDKCGAGLNFTDFTMCMIVCTIKGELEGRSLEQLVGRVLRTTKPVTIIDFRDNDPISNSHLTNVRIPWYQKCAKSLKFLKASTQLDEIN